MIKLEKKESIYFLTMDAEENRWNTTFVREIAEALDTIENDGGPGALITFSTNTKFVKDLQKQYRNCIGEYSFWF